MYAVIYTHLATDGLNVGKIASKHRSLTRAELFAVRLGRDCRTRVAELTRDLPVGAYPADDAVNWVVR